MLAFLPKNEEEANAIHSAVQEHSDLKEHPDTAIHNSWAVPDQRSSRKIDEFERKRLNIKHVGSQEICILTGDKHIEDPDIIKEYTWLNPALAEFIKSGAELKLVSL